MSVVNVNAIIQQATCKIKYFFAKVQASKKIALMRLGKLAFPVRSKTIFLFA